jgi:outer membrane biosynthesis protein TonB
VGPKSNSLGIETWTMERAKKAGLTTDNWRKYPEAMLFARCLSSGIRSYCPDALSVGAPVYAIGEVSGNQMSVDGDLLDAGAVVTKPITQQEPEEEGELPDAFGKPEDTTEDTTEEKPAEEKPARKKATTRKKAAAKKDESKKVVEVKAEPVDESDDLDFGEEEDDPKEDTNAALAGEDPGPEENEAKEFPAEAYGPDGEVLKNAAGLTWAEWDGMSDKEKASEGLIVEATVKMIYKKAADAGYSEAAVNQGVMKGFGVPFVWQLSKSEGGQVLNRMMRKSRGK